MAKHTIRVRLFDARQNEPLDGGIITVEGEEYGMSEDRALELALASGHFEATASYAGAASCCHLSILCG
jgi:hypothetical protein